MSHRHVNYPLTLEPGKRAASVQLFSSGFVKMAAEGIVPGLFLPGSLKGEV